MRLKSFLFGLTTLVMASSSAWAVSISTGSAANWMAGAGTTTTGVAVVETIQVPTGIWINSTANTCVKGTGFGAGDACWVGVTSSDGTFGSGGSGAAPGTYTFTLAIGSLVGTPGSFSVGYATDNDVVWTISNGSLGGVTSCAQENCFGAQAGALRTLSGSFGTNSVLTATIRNITSVNTPMGLFVQGNALAAPEPSSYAMLGLGGLAILAARLRRK